nr:type II secretion system protein N [Sedimenticola hydrogenitrophicus]
MAVQFIPESGAVTTPTPAVNSSASPDKLPTPNYDELANWNLFGNPKVKTKAKKVVPIVAPETRLKLELQGIVYSNPPADGIAIISEPGKPQKTYHLGDALPGNATLYALEQDHVILQRNGRHETLTLRKSPDMQTPMNETTVQSDLPVQRMQVSTDKKII